MKKALFFAPLSSTTKFKSFGSEINKEEIVGQAFDFVENSPNSGRSEKYVRMQTSAQRHVKYEVPQSFIDTVDLKGLVITFWVKIKSMREMPLVEFDAALVHDFRRAHIWAQSWQDVWVNDFGAALAQTASVFQFDKWHHVGVVLKRSSAETEIWVDKVKKGSFVSVLILVCETKCELSEASRDSCSQLGLFIGEPSTLWSCAHPVN